MSSFKNQPVSPDEAAVHKLLEKASRYLTKKYCMQTVGTNIAMPSGVVKLLGLDFQIKGPLSREELRKILIASAHDFLKLINDDPELKYYLSRSPFTIENVDLTLFIVDVDGRGLRDPHIGIASIKRGCLGYDVLVSEYNKDLKMEIPKYKEEMEESYQEALKLLQAAEGTTNKESKS